LKNGSADFARLWKYSVGFNGVWIAHIGRQMNLFNHIAAGPVSIEDLIVNTKLHPVAVRAWCSAAESYRLITVKKDKLQLKRNIRRILIDTTSPEYIGGQFSYLALRSLEYSAFEELFRSGKTRKKMSTLSAIEQATDWEHYAFLAAVRRHKKLRQKLSNGCRLLDLGCGTGSMLAKVHKEYPKSSLVGIDPSGKALAMAHAIVDSKPISLIKSAGESMKFANEFDIVYLGESLYATKDKGKVVSNCWKALKNGGTIAIVEGLLPNSKSPGGSSRLIMGMQLDFALQGHKFMNKKDMVRLLNGRFSRVHFKNLGGDVYLISATKKK
jgi:SAM-dependent methyltransferase